MVGFFIFHNIYYYMKIIITESQRKRLFLNENEELEDDLTHFFLDVSNKLAESM